MHPLEAKLFHAWPPQGWQDVSVVVAVSGGADSVALLRALHALKTTGEGRLLVAHFNHRWRAAEADADTTFVRELSQRLALPFFLGNADAPLATTARGESREAVARDQRYDFLQAVAEKHGARYLVTGHTADDQVETILHRIVRGTGLRGLSGIPRQRPLSAAVTLIRPLLEIRRDDLLLYLSSLGQLYRSDSSNADNKFTRNRLRHELLPLLRSRYNADIDAALLRLGSLAAETRVALSSQVRELAERAVRRRTTSEIELAAAPLDEQPEWLVTELLIELWREQQWPAQAMSHDRWRELHSFLAARSDSAVLAPPQLNLPGNIFVRRLDDAFILVAQPRPVDRRQAN